MLLTYLLLIFIILSFVISFSFFKPKKQQNKNIVFKTNSDLYDKEYVNMYDTVHYDYYRIQKDLNIIMPISTPDSYILDIGSGTGIHVNELNKKGIPTIGIDNSDAMIEYSKKYKHQYKKGNVLNMSTFHPETFSHITCFYYTLYYIQNKDQLLYNIHQWLIPGGFFIVHLSKKCTFGSSNMGSNQFTYKRKIKHDKVYETIIQNNKTICNEHTFYMESIPFILELIHQLGFIQVSNENYDIHNILYIFQKPN
jgi:ubiquinone/menaquinone biosynthesis C-methylase UbiE